MDVVDTIALSSLIYDFVHLFTSDSQSELIAFHSCFVEAVIQEKKRITQRPEQFSSLD